MSGKTFYWIQALTLTCYSTHNGQGTVQICGCSL